MKNPVAQQIVQNEQKLRESSTDRYIPVDIELFDGTYQINVSVDIAGSLAQLQNYLKSNNIDVNDDDNYTAAYDAYDEVVNKTLVPLNKKFNKDLQKLVTDMIKSVDNVEELLIQKLEKTIQG